jgi:hypothetical protein
MSPSIYKEQQLLEYAALTADFHLQKIVGNMFICFIEPVIVNEPLQHLRDNKYNNYKVISLLCFIVIAVSLQAERDDSC